MTFTDLVQNAAGISVIVASLTLLAGTITLIKTLVEYRDQLSMKRFEKFQEMRERFNGSADIQEICLLLEDDDQKLSTLDYLKKRNFLGFYEEVALMRSSGLLKDEIAHYMFGYYAIRCYQSRNFWSDANRDSYYWSVFCRFARDMQAIEETVVDGSAPKQLEQFRF